VGANGRIKWLKGFYELNSAKSARRKERNFIKCLIPGDVVIKLEHKEKTVKGGSLFGYL